MSEHQQRQIQLYQSNEHPCAYLEGLQSRNLVIDPNLGLNPALYESFLELGFRRSGSMVYRPACRECQKCTPIRIPVQQFRPNRSQRRILRYCSENLEIADLSAQFSSQQYELFKRYLEIRHPGGEMSGMTSENFYEFLSCEALDTRFIEFRLKQQLVGVAISDRLPNSESAVYSFFDPDHSQMGLGVYAVLWQIQSCLRQNKPWLYLGYWIADCQKMSYKTNYKPFQLRLNGEWTEPRYDVFAN